jgi:hypothetical protein
MVGAIANSAVAVRRLGAAPWLAATDAGGAEEPAGLAGAGGRAGSPLAGSWAIAGLASPGAVPGTGRKAADPGEAGLSVAKGPGREGMAGGGTTGLIGSPGRAPPGREGRAGGGTTGLTGRPGRGPPDHIRVLAGEAGLFAPWPPNTEAAVTIGLPHAWHTVTGCVSPGEVAGRGAWQ